MDVSAIYCDGGCVGRNPSLLGGTWAYCFVDARGFRIHDGNGIITPEQAKVEKVTNNLTELLAAVIALTHAPAGWSGILWTDSRVTIARIVRSRRQARLNGIPEWLRLRLAVAKAQAGRYEVRHLAGHPTKMDLRRGSKRSGMAISVHNVYCDRMCREAAKRFQACPSSASATTAAS